MVTISKSIVRRAFDVQCAQTPGNGSREVERKRGRSAGLSCLRHKFRLRLTQVDWRGKRQDAR
jgi:hypothetical protein